MNEDNHPVGRPSGESQRTLPEYTRLDPTGPKAFQVNPAGVAVYWADYKRLLDALRPYRDELLKIAADVGEPDDPFAAWEAIQALLDRIEELEGALEPFVDTLNVSEESAVKDGRNPASVPDTFDVLAFRNVPGLKLAAFRRARKALSGEKP